MSFKSGTHAYVEHVAIRVRDIHWHIRFFRDALGMELREVEGPAENPRQCWTVGGMQFIAAPELSAPPTDVGGVLAHLGIMVDDLGAAVTAARAAGAVPLAQGGNWLELPDGLALEFIQAASGAVEQALAVRPRA